MHSNWQVLKSPPVILAIFQIRFNPLEDLNKLIVNDKNIRNKFPFRHDNYESNIGVQGTPAPGLSTIKAKADTKISSYTYLTSDQKTKFIIERGSLTYVNEGFYNGWDFFKKEVQECLKLISDQLKSIIINRTSIRFINKFSIPSNENILDYISKTISTDTELNYPVTRYSFNVNLQIPGTDTVAMVNHALEPSNVNSLNYFLDIDVLDHRQIQFDLSLLNDQLESIRIIKNTIFFDALKQKTLDLCNL